MLRHLVRFQSPWLARSLFGRVTPSDWLRYQSTRVARLATLAAAHAKRAPPEFSLRDYQKECIQSVLKHAEEGHTRLGVSLATGSGKTVIFSQLIELAPDREKATQTLILAHRRELVEQAARQCERFYPSKKIDIEMASSHATGMADITVASVQSLTSGDRLDKFDPSRFKLVIVDEAHHITASRYATILTHFGLDQKVEPGTTSRPLLVGVSATFARHDGIQLGQYIDYIVYHKDYTEMINSKWLCDVRFSTVSFDLDLSNVKLAAGGDFHVASLSKVVNTKQANEVTVKAWLTKAASKDVVQCRSTIVFCADIGHVQALTEEFRKYGIDARYVTGRTPAKERGERIQAFRNFEFPVLVNCGVFSEGTDIANIDCVLIARPTRSRTLLVQMIGRGMRLNEGKKDCLVIDMVASLEKGLVTTPTLFGLDPETLVDEASSEDLAQAAAKEGEVSPLFQKKGPPQSDAEVKSVKFTDYDSVIDLVEDTKQDSYFKTHTPNSWVQVGTDRLVLQSLEKGHLLIEKGLVSGVYNITFTPRLPRSVFVFGSKGRGSPFGKTASIGFNDSLEGAIRAADTYARDRFPRRDILRYSPWRQLPLTDAQLKYLSKCYQKFTPASQPSSGSNRQPGRSQKPLEFLTRGEAADRITRIRFGAKTRFDAIKTEARRREKQAKKEEKAKLLRSGAVLKVGPVAN